MRVGGGGIAGERGEKLQDRGQKRPITWRQHLCDIQEGKAASSSTIKPGQGPEDLVLTQSPIPEVDVPNPVGAFIRAAGCLAAAVLRNRRAAPSASR